MAGKPIDENQILKDGAIESIISDFDKLYNSLKKNDEVLREVGKSMKGVKYPENSKDFEKVLGNMNELEKSYKAQHQTQLDLLKIEKSQQDLRAKKERADQAEIRTAKLREGQQKKEITQYQIASRELTVMKNRYKDLAYQKSQGIKLTKEETKEYRDLGRSIKDADGNLKRIDKSVGDNFRNVGNYKNAISGLKGALGQLGLAFGGIALAKGAFETIKNFDELNADMAKTLGVSTEAASKLSLEFTKLGSVTSISGLQEMAVIGGQFGISADQISGFVKSMDKANIALGADFGGVEETAKQLGGLRNAFTDIKTTKIEDDLLGIGNALNELSSKGAKVDLVADFANRISAVAIPMGVASGEVLGLSATLAKLNVNAERGGTAVSTIFQKMTQDSAGFAKVAGVSTEEFTKLLNTDLVGAFKLVAQSFKGMDGDNVKMSTTLKALGLTGSGASEVFLKMSNNTELLDENIKLATKSLTEQDSILQEVEKKSSTVGASIEKVKNSYDAFILGVNDGTGAQNGIINFFDFIAKNLPAIISLFAKFVALWVTYKAVMKTMEIAKHIKDLGGLSSIIKDNATNLKSATKETEGFGKSLKGAGIALAIGLLVEVGLAIWDIASGAQEAEMRISAMNKALAEADQFVGSVKGQVNSKFEAEKLKNETLLANGEINQAVFDQNMKYAKESRASRLKFEIQTENEIRDKALASVRAGQKKFDEIQEKNPAFRNNDEDKFVIRFTQQQAQVRESNTVLKGLIGFQKELATEELKSLNTTKLANKEQKKAKKEITKTIIDYTKAIRDLNAEMLEGSDEASTEYMRNSKKLANDYQDAQDKINSDTATTVIKKNEYLLILEKKYYKDLEEMGDAYTQGQIDKARQDIVDRIELEKSAFDLKSGRVDAEARIQALTDYNAKRAEIINSQILTDEEKNKQLEKLEEIHEDRMLEIQLNGLKKRLENEILIQQEIANQVDLGVTSKEYEDAQGRILELQEQILNLGAGKFKAEKEDNTLKDKLKKVANYFSNLMDAIQDKINQTFDRLIEAQNKSIENSKSVVANLQASANAGNLQATKSILAEEKAQEKAQKRIEKLQKRQQLTQMITGVLSSYSAKVANGDKNALLSTITEASVLSAFLKSLPSFAVGTDYLDVNGNGVDGDGGIPVIAHRGERIVPAEENKAFGFGTKNKELVKAWSFYKQGLLKPITGVTPMVMQQDNSEILRSINDGFSKINNYNMSFEQLFSTFSLIIEKKKNGDIFTSKKTFKV